MTELPLDMASCNRLLAMLSPATRQRLVSCMTRVSLAPRRPLLCSGRARDAIYFPLDALAVLSHSDEYSRTAGVALVGCDGVVGIGLLLGSATSIHDVHVVIEGEALCMSRDSVLHALRHDGEFGHLMARYAHALLAQISFIAFCERIHSIEQRLIRWLLLARDRTPHDGLILSQETLASVIGMRREVALTPLKGSPNVDDAIPHDDAGQP